jgi:hypothetical protein
MRNRCNAALQLAVLMEDLKRYPKRPISIGPRLSVAPDPADAHFNLALLCDAQGLRQESGATPERISQARARRSVASSADRHQQHLSKQTVINAPRRVSCVSFERRSTPL